MSEITSSPKARVCLRGPSHRKLTDEPARYAPRTTAGGWVLGLWLCCNFSSACSSDDDGGSSSGGSVASVASCNATCDAQEEVRGSGCAPSIKLKTCKQLCAQLVDSIKGCGKQFNAYYECTAADGFTCDGALVTSKTNDCDDERAALESCRNP